MEYTTRPETVMLEDSQHPRHNPCPTAKCSRLLEALLEDEDLHPLMFGCGHDLQQEQDAKLVPPKTARILNSPPMLVPSSRDVHIFSSGYSANKLRKKHPYYQQLIRKHYETWNKLEDRKEANGPLIDKIMEEIDNAYYYDNRNGMRRVEKSELAELIKQKMRDEKRRHNRGSKAGPSKRGDRIDPTKSIKKARIDPDELAKSVKYKEQVVSNEVAKIDQEIMTLVNSGEPELARVVTPNKVNPTMIDIDEVFQGPQGLQDLAALDQLMLLPDNDDVIAKDVVEAEEHEPMKVSLQPKPQPPQQQSGIALVGAVQQIIAKAKKKSCAHENHKEILTLAESLCRVYERQHQTVCALQTVCQEREKIIDSILGAPFATAVEEPSTVPFSTESLYC